MNETTTTIAVTLHRLLDTASAAPWNPHPRFAGVAMKTLVAGAETAGALSQHLVRVDPGCALDWHEHPAQCELHLVLDGDAQATIGGQETAYAPATQRTIPLGVRHCVRAGDRGITLLASFSPALG